MADQTPENPFAKDFDYLVPFLTNVAQHVAKLQGERGERLRELLSGEAQKWSEIAALLSGANPVGESGSAHGSEPTPEPAPKPTSGRVPSAMQPTVGSLRGIEPKRRSGD